MSKLEELIEELCPDGVEYKKVKEVFTRIKGTPITAGKMKEIASDDGDVRVFAGGKTVIDAFEKDIPNANITRVPSVLVQSRGVIDVVFYEKPFTFKNEMWAYTHKERTMVKFLYYVLKDNVQVFRDAASGMGSLPQISLPVTEDFIIPIPPLSVQEEIVRILDNFTDLTAELQAELQARAKQYEYYTQTLLNKPIGNIYKLGEIATIKTGRKPDKIYEELSQYEYINAGTSNSGYVNAYNCEGDTTTTPSRGQGGIGFVGYQSRDFWLGPLCYRIKSKNTDNVLNKYIYYYLKCFPEKILQYKKEGGTPSINASDLINIDIIVPSREEQEKIVTILNSFESLTTNISEGLPAEIEARQKQYEYYRNKLLTFKELG